MGLEAENQSVPENDESLESQGYLPAKTPWRKAALGCNS